MYKTLQPVLPKELETVENDGLFKREHIIITPQGADIKINGGAEVVNFCANNYLGFSSHSKVIAAAKKSYRYLWLWHVFCSIYLWYPKCS